MTWPDDGKPWPRDLFCYGHVSVDLAEDTPAFEHYKSKMLIDGCNRSAEANGVKLAEGHEWQVRWYGVTQHEEDLSAAINLPYGYGPSVRAGDWRWRAEGKVVPI